VHIIAYYVVKHLIRALMLLIHHLFPHAATTHTAVAHTGAAHTLMAPATTQVTPMAAQAASLHASNVAGNIMNSVGAEQASLSSSLGSSF
jgi:hypothetical protein